MRRILSVVLPVLCVFYFPARSQAQKTGETGHYMFAWTGDVAHKGNDFLAVIDADPASPTYGHLLTTVVTDQQTEQVHHTEYTMPASGMLFANDHKAGRTFIFDLRDPLHPKVATSFTDMAGDITRTPSCGCPTGMCWQRSSMRMTATLATPWVGPAAWSRLTIKAR